jgi:hypothetical protein
MLEAIIEKKNVNGLLRFEASALDEAILADAKRYAVLKTELHYLNFVAGSVSAAVAAAENRNTLAIGKKLFGKPDHHGSFARTTDGKIANADDRPLQPSLPEQSLGIKP